MNPSHITRTRNASLPAWTSSGLLLGLVLVVVGLLAWSLNRGLDITDEGFYLLSYRYPDEYKASFSAFHLLVNGVPGLAGASFLTYRIVALLATVSSATLFGLSLSRWLRVHVRSGRPLSWVSQPVVVVAFVVVGALMAYSITPRTLSYNGLNSFFLLLSAGSIMQALSRAPRRGAAGAWLWLAGLCCGLDGFVKVSTALLLLAAHAALVLWMWRGHRRWALLGLGMLLLGAASGAALYFACIQPPLQWWRYFTREMAVLQATDYGTVYLMQKYLGNVLQLGRAWVFPFGPLILGPAVVAWWTARYNYRLTRPMWLGAAGVVGGCLLFTAVQVLRLKLYSTAFLNGLNTLPLLTALLLSGALVLVMSRVAARPRTSWWTNYQAPQAVALGLWLAALPILAAVGTFNELFLNVIMDLGPWFGLLLLVAALLPLPASTTAAWLTALLLWAPALLAAEQTVWGTLRVPYLLPTDMQQQNVPLRIPGLDQPLLVDAPTAAFVKQLSEVLRRGGFRPGDPLLGYYDAPGLVYMVGGVSPGAPWYFTGIDARNCHALDNTRHDLSRALVLLTTDITAEMTTCLQTHQLRFPQDYELIGKVASPYARNVYMYRTEQHTVRVYAPRPAR